MRGRQACWSDRKLQRLAQRFVPATDEVWRLHNRDDLDCRFFQGFCEEGHYGGRARPTSTRQGIYCCTPSGKFLASINTTHAPAMAKMLERALAKWRTIPPDERYLPYDPAARAKEIRRAEQRFPEEGLALRVYSRDLPRRGRKPPRDWRGRAWNVDSLWYLANEARQMIPADPKPDATCVWPAPLVQRLACRNLVDNVRGQTNGYRLARVARLGTRVVSVDGPVVAVVFRGRTEAGTTKSWPGESEQPHEAEAKDGDASGVQDLQADDPWARGVRTTLYGEGAFDLETGRFVRFELVAAGTRWGRTRFNFRQGDDAEAPIAWAVVLDREDPARRVAPAELGRYDW